MPSGAFMIGDDGKAYVIAGPGAIQPVSTPPVETAIREMNPVSCLYYEDEGHMFCCIVFRDAPAWCFDIATGEWHERAEGSLLAPWTAVHSVKWRGGWHASQDDGTIRRFARSATDGDKPLVKQATSHTIRSQDGQRMVLRELEIHAPQGFSAGRIGLQISRDGGATFGIEKPRDIGPIGAYAKRMNWRNLGLAREMCARVQWTDDVAIVSQARVRL
jgi:hypothetical protein